MAATKEDISNWFDKGVELKATHMIVVCDRFDYKDYPVYVQKDQDVHKIEEEFSNKDMQEIVEVYCLTVGANRKL